MLRFIFTFNEFDDVYLLTGELAGTQVASVRVYDLLTARGDIGAASAQALVLAFVLAGLLALYFRFVGRRAGEPDVTRTAPAQEAASTRPRPAPPRPPSGRATASRTSCSACCAGW